jgi:hypothetical protein
MCGCAARTRAQELNRAAGTAVGCEDELHGDAVASGIVLGRDVGEEAC